VDHFWKDPCLIIDVNFKLRTDFNKATQSNAICSAALSKALVSVKVNTSFKFFNKSYNLRGVVYYGNNHYTSCIVSENKSVWYHDGIQTGKDMTFEGAVLSKKSKNWNIYNNKHAVLFVYICT
jgi:hypothetical protein